MCGRAKLETDVSEIKIAFRIPPERPTPNFAPNWNVAPTQTLPIVRYDSEDRQRSLDIMRWGLIPFWAKDVKIGYTTINAMAETVETKPACREAFKRRRCLVPIDNFYEWQKTGPGQTALRHRARRSEHHGLGRSLGDMALPRQRDGTQLHHHHHDAE
jgi:putative SOS response-associated peptidase YedK